MRKVLALAMAASIVAFAASAPASASTSVTPSVTFSLTQRTVVSGVQPRLTYAGQGLPATSRLFLQLQYGTPARWTDVEALNGISGNVSLPALPVGVYRLRVRAVRGIGIVAVAPGQILTVVPAASSSGCGICSLFGGIGGAIVNWVLGVLPWIFTKLPW